MKQKKENFSETGLEFGTALSHFCWKSLYRIACGFEIGIYQDCRCVSASRLEGARRNGVIAPRILNFEMYA